MALLNSHFARLLPLVIWGCTSTPAAPAEAPVPPREQVEAPATPAVLKGDYAVIPVPVELTKQSGAFAVNSKTRVVTSHGLTARGVEVADTCARLLRTPTGLDVLLEPLAPGAEQPENTILFALDPSLEHDEQYRLSVTTSRVSIVAKAPRGLFYGLQTLRQLGPPELESKETIAGASFQFPAVDINDYPRFSYRGLHLDVARHFFPTEFVKKYIDRLATYKLNTFHWHLTEDQGWRIEIKKYPKLTEVGAFRDGTLVGHKREQPHKFDGKRYGGFYTQEEVREVVEYARKRFVTVMPEIELPGHSLAALAAYPELACTEGPFEVSQTWGIFEDVYCPKEETFRFLEDVLSEVVELFPSPFIHIGGDEVPKTRWKESPIAQKVMKREGLKNEEELQAYFIRRIEGFLHKNGRRLVGWDEILEGGLAPRATVMSWRGTAGGFEAAKQGHDVIMAPDSYMYFNMYQDNDVSAEPLAIGGYIPVERVYEFEPIPENLSKDKTHHILGAQANLWSEYIKTGDLAEYMVHPRLQALSEVVWSPKEARNFSDFAGRVVQDFERLDVSGVRYGRQIFKVRQKAHMADGTFTVELSTPNGDPIYYNLDGSPPGPNATPYQGPLTLAGPATVTAVGVRNGRPSAAPVTRDYFVGLATGKPSSYEEAFSPRYPSAGELALSNGIRGSKNFGDGEWLGFSGANLEATIDLGSLTSVSHIELDFLRDVGVWIMLPKNVEFLGSEDGKNFRSLATFKTEVDERAAEPLIHLYKADLKAEQLRYLKVRAQNYGKLPKWHPGAGRDAWLFTSELLVQ